MGRAWLAGIWALLGVAAASFVGCGARSELDSKDYLPNGGAGTQQGTAGAGPLIDPAVCTGFAPLWDSRASATTLQCDSCLRDIGCGWPSDSTCLRGTRCVDRRCSVLSDLSTLCTCIESCFSSEESVCNQRWSTFMTCASAACKAACS